MHPSLPARRFGPFALALLSAVAFFQGCSKAAPVGTPDGVPLASDPVPAFRNIVVDTPATSASGHRLVPGLKRLGDCSLTRALADFTTRTLVSTEPDFDAVLHDRAHLATTPGVFPHGCTDPAPGTSSQGGALAGHLGDGSYFGAAINYVGTPKLQTFVTDGGNGLRSVQEVSVTPDGTQLRPATVTSADFDGDGKDSLVVALYDYVAQNGAVAVLAPKFDGTFVEPRYFPMPFQVSGVTVIDFDGDGHLDIAAIGSIADPVTGATLGILYGKAGGGFEPRRFIDPSKGASGDALIAADFNNDGRVDIATSAGQVLLGMPGRTWHKATGTAGWTSGDLAAGDFDEDGNLDIAVATYQGIALFLGRGHGLFDRGPRYAGIYGSQHVVVTDIDGDGHQDLMVGYAARGTYVPHENAEGISQYLLGRGDGTFAGVPILPGDVQLLADFDGDGAADLVTMDGFANTLRFYRNQGGGTLAAPVQAATNFHAYDLAAANFGGSAALDLLALAAGNPGQLQLRIGKGNGQFAATGPSKALPFPAAFTNRSLALGDFDGDGRRDVAVIGWGESFPNPRQGGLATVRNTGTGKLGAVRTITSKLVTPVDIAVAKIDDGDTLDIAIADQGDPYASPPVEGSVRVYRGKGDGSFLPAIILKPFPRPDALAIADMDHDGHADLVVAGPAFDGGHEQVAVLRGNGTGFEAPIRTPISEGFIGGLATGFINGDGIRDVVTTACCGLAYNSYLIGKGDGHFKPEVLLPAPISGGRPQLVDLNGDGQAEWVMSLPETGTVVLENAGVP